MSINQITEIAKAGGGSVYNYFWSNFLNTAAGSIPVPALWICVFDTLDTERVILSYQNTLVENPNVDLNLNVHTPVSVVCAQALTLPSDGNSTTKLGIDNTPFLKGNILNSREDLNKLTIQFLETNLSYADTYLRPWIEAVGYRGLIDPNIKTKIDIILFQKSESNKALGFTDKLFKGPKDKLKSITNKLSLKDDIPEPTWEPRKMFSFYNAAPVHIGGVELNYTTDRNPNISVDFAYDYYTMKSWPLQTEGILSSNYQRKDPDSTSFLDRAGKKAGDFLKDKASKAVESLTASVLLQANKVVSNVEGAFTGAVENTIAHYQNQASALLNRGGDRLVDGITKARQSVEQALGAGRDDPKGVVSISGGSSIERVRAKNVGNAVDSTNDVYTPVYIPTNDHVQNLQTNIIQPERLNVPDAYDKDYIIPEEDDMTTYVTPEQAKNLGVLGAGNLTKASLKDSVDTPLFFGSTDIEGFVPMRPPVGGTPSYIQLIKHVPTKQDDVPNPVTLSSQLTETPVQNPSPSLGSQNQFIKPKGDDVPIGENIPVQFVPVKK